MEKKGKYRGSSHSLAGMAIMAHMLGFRSNIKFISWEGSDNLPLYEIEVMGIPAFDWSANPHDPKSELKNRKAVLVRVALHVAECYWPEHLSNEELMEPSYALLWQQNNKATFEFVKHYFNWSNNKERDATELFNYIFRAMKAEVYGKIDGALREFSDYIELTGGEVDAGDVLETLKEEFQFACLEYNMPKMSPMWLLCFPVAV